MVLTVPDSITLQSKLKRHRNGEQPACHGIRFGNRLEWWMEWFRLAHYRMGLELVYVVDVPDGEGLTEAR